MRFSITRFATAAVLGVPEILYRRDMPTWEQICARRIARHGIAAPLDTDIPGAVAAMCGAHAQVLSAAELSIGLRLPSVTRADVSEALWINRTLIKMYGPRGTVHLLPVRDLPMWTGAMSAIPHRSGIPPASGLTADQLEQTVAAIDDALTGRELIMDELSDEVIRRTGPWAADLTTPNFGGMAPRWRQGLGLASNRGTLCFGPNRGRKVTYAKPPEFSPIEPQAAIKQLVTRYLTAYGPAIPANFAKWLGATPKWASDIFHGHDQIQEIETGHIVKGDTDWPEPDLGSLRLLPYFDAYTVGVQPRELAFPGPAATRALSHGQAGTYPVLVIDGIVRGIWHQRRSGGKIALTIEPFVDLSKVMRQQLLHEAERIGAIMEATVEAAFDNVTVAPHR
jgi:DNA glycosylase AlkZ-like